MVALSDEALAAKTTEFRARLADGATLDELLPEAFATVREAASAASSGSAISTCSSSAAWCCMTARSPR